MITNHVTKNNKSNFYTHVKELSLNKFTIPQNSINSIVSGPNKIFENVLKADYPFETR